MAKTELTETEKQYILYVLERVVRERPFQPGSGMNKYAYILQQKLLGKKYNVIQYERETYKLIQAEITKLEKPNSSTRNKGK